MATVIAAANGNLTAAASWKLANLILNSEAASTNMTTSNVDSAAFVLPAQEIDGFAVKLSVRNPGSPTNQLILTLRNSTTATDIWSVSIDVSALPVVSATDANGGWILVVPGTLHTPNGTDSYIVRARVSATSTTVGLFRDGTAGNWSRFVRRTATQAPVAGDDMLVLGEFTGGSAKTVRTITMDQTAATDYGSGVTTNVTPALGVGNGGVLSLQLTASTAYILRMSGRLVVYSAGSLVFGTRAGRLPATSSFSCEFDAAADNQFGVYLHKGASFQVGGANKGRMWTTLAATLTGGTAAATVANDCTGWKSGDRVAIASTSGTRTETEVLTLSADVGGAGTALSFTGNAVNTHSYSAAEGITAEVMLLTFNITIQSLSSSNMSFVHTDDDFEGVIDVSWLAGRYLGNSGGGLGFKFDIGEANGGAVVTLEDIHSADSEGVGFYFDIGGVVADLLAAGPYAVRRITAYNCALGNNCTSISIAAAISNATVDDIFALFTSTANGEGVNWMGTMSGVTDREEVPAAFTNIRGACTGGYGIEIQQGFNGCGDPEDITIGPFTAHGCANHGVNFGGDVQNVTVAEIRTWRNRASDASGFICSYVTNVIFTSIVSFGNQGQGLRLGDNEEIYRATFKSIRVCGDTTFAQPYGIVFGRNLSEIPIMMLVETLVAGQATGLWVAHSTADLQIPGAITKPMEVVILNALLASTTELENIPSGLVHPSFFAFQKHDQVANVHKTLMAEGTLAIETTVFDQTPSLKMTPLSALYRLASNRRQRGRGFMVGVLNGASVTVSVMVRKSAAYNGSAPRLRVEGNTAIGVTAATIDTHALGADVWETLSATVGPVTDNGVLEFYVDCNGTAGDVYVDTWRA